MITVKTISKEDGKVELDIKKGTPYMTMFLGCEMLIETILAGHPENTIDEILHDLKLRYERDNSE